MNDRKLEEIKIEREVLRKRKNALDKLESKIYSHDRAASLITADTMLTDVDIKPEELNYILGASKGFVDGFQSAINTIVEVFSNDFRDIPMTIDELDVLVELGKTHERAWLKDYKQKQIVEKAGWKLEFRRSPVWVRKEQNE